MELINVFKDRVTTNLLHYKIKQEIIDIVVFCLITSIYDTMSSDLEDLKSALAKLR